MVRPTRPYVDTRVSDLVAAGGVATAAAGQWELEQPVLLRSGMNAIYRCGDVVLRVAKPSVSAAVSLELASVLAEAGVPVVEPARADVFERDDVSVTAWSFVAASGEPIDWCGVGRLVRRVHDLDPALLPDGLPLPSPVTFPWWQFDDMLAAVGEHLDEAASAGVRSALERHEGWRDFTSTVVCHGDVHPGNVIMSHAGPVLLDWDLMCRAPAGWDHAPLMTWTERWGGDPGVYEAFADGYGWSGRGDAFAEAVAELRLVAATLMRLRAGLADPAAMPEARRRLAHWRGEPGAPQWRAQ